MSKIYDVEKMYGQDFSIVTTNAPSNIIKQAKKLLPNILLISSPQNSEGEDSDNNLPAMFITDYNAQPLQLTYSFYMKNGLNYSEENSYAFINIDNSTITTENADGSGKLKVETDNLKSASFSNKGVVKLSTISTDIDRNLSENYQLTDSVSNKFNQSTFISVNDEGILYINNDLLSLINNIVDLKIKQKIDSIKIMLNNNLKMWIVINYINGLDVSSDGKIFTLGAYDAIKLDDLGTVNNTGAISLTFDLYYYSFNNESENVNIIDETNKIYDISFSDDGTQTKVSPVQDNDELYQHQINNITLTFLPNYFIENNESYNQDYQLLFEVDDKKDTLSFRQNKLSNFNSDNFKITLEPTELAVNAVLNKSLKTRLIEKITNRNVLRSIKSNESDNSLVRFVIDTFIIHPDAQFKNIDNYLQYDLIKGYEYIPNETELSIFLDNIDNSGQQTKLYDFITNIISDTSLESDGENYIIEFDGDLLDNSGRSINNYVKREIISLSEIKYYIGIGVKFSIISSKNVNLGTYSVILPVLLDMSKSAKYGYLYISFNDNNGGDNTPYIYYNNRSGVDRKMVSHINTEYKGAEIDTTQLFCIFDSDLSLSNGQEASPNNKLSINYTEFKEFNANEEDPTNNNVTIPKENVSFDSELISFDPDNNKKILVSLSAPGSTNVIGEMANNIYDLLKGNNEFTFTIDFNKNDNGKGNIIRSQEVKMNVNLLHIMLSNIYISETKDPEDLSQWINLGNQIRWYDDNTVVLSGDPYQSTNTYQQMNNYVIKNETIDNNDIKSIKIKIPNYIIIALKKGNQFNIVLSCYHGDNIKDVIITLKRSPSTNANENDIIQASLSSENLQISNQNILLFKQDNFVIDYSKPSDHYIQLSVTNTNFKLPKLLMISFNFGDNKMNNKTSYIEDTVTSSDANSGTIITTNNPYVRESNVGTKKLYDIIYFTSNDEQQGDYDTLKNILINESSQTYYDYNVKISKLSVGQSNYTFTRDSNSDLTNKFCLVSKTDENEIDYFQVSHGVIIDNFKYKFQYLTNNNGILDNYNLFCKNTPIDGATQYRETPYDLRFTELYIKPKNSGSSQNYSWQFTDSLLNLYKFKLSTGSDPQMLFEEFIGIFTENLFNFKINQNTFIINKTTNNNTIKLKDSNDNSINDPNQPIDCINGDYNIYFNKEDLYQETPPTLDINDLDTGYKINVLSFDWPGFTNGNDPMIELTQNSNTLQINIKIYTSLISDNDDILSKFDFDQNGLYKPNEIMVNAKNAGVYRSIQLKCGTVTNVNEGYEENIDPNTLFFKIQENSQSKSISFINYLNNFLNDTSLMPSDYYLPLYINLFGDDDDPINHSTLKTGYSVKFEKDTHSTPGLEWQTNQNESNITIENPNVLEWTINNNDQNNTYPSLLIPNDTIDVNDVEYESTNPTVASIEKIEDNDTKIARITIIGEGTTTIKAKFDGNNSYLGQTVSFELTVTGASQQPDPETPEGGE